ncbi:MAG TPA: serine/threonine-protein kinase [Polyangia bacterium]|jgi:serine/threonine protein kinase/tetratricopeptide (TPR) repeat protein|nr:serine/threonine-protein kinase [Polyangia bacterium]
MSAQGVPPDNTRSPDGSLARGSSIGRYVVLNLVGRGGMGEVYAAYDPELDRKVAVKLLRVAPGNGVSLNEGRTRTLREAQAIAKLSHPNVVVVYDVGPFRDEIFIAMEFVEGNTVGYWLQAKPRTWQEVLKVFLAAGNGLLAAHEKDLVHRDFKPDNVMVGGDGQIRVMDFGLAQQVNDKNGNKPTTLSSLRPVTPTGTQPAEVPVAVDPDLLSTRVIAADPAASRKTMTGIGALPDLMPRNSGAFEVNLTRTGAMVGTPAYMSPEQFLGMETDARTDQFSFCVALYEGLYGERPFAGTSMFGLTANVVQGIVNDPPASSKVPPWIRKVLLRGLKPNVADRYPTMQALLTALAHDPRAARRKWALAAGALLVPLVVGLGVRHSMKAQTSICEAGPAKLGGIWELEKLGRGESAGKAAIRTAFLATGKSYAADAFANVSRALDTYVRGWSDMYREACEATQVRGEQSAEVLDLRMSCLGEKLAGVKALTKVFSEANGSVVENAVTAAHALGPLDRCADVPLLRAVVKPPEDPATRARVDDLRARLASVQALQIAGRWSEGIAKAVPLADEARALNYKPLLAEALNLLGLLQFKSADITMAERSFQEAYWAAEVSRHDEVKAEVAVAEVYVVGYLQARPDAGENWSRYAEAVLQRMGGHERLQSWLLNGLGTVYEGQGRLPEALKAGEAALALKQKVLPPDHPDIGLSLGNLANWLGLLGRNQEALAAVDRAVAILEKGFGANHPEVAIPIMNRGEILNALGRPREARVSFERALAIWERELGLEHSNLGYALTGIGLSYLSQGDAAAAIAPLERAYKIREAKENNAARRADTQFALARALWDGKRDRPWARTLAANAKSTYGTANAKDKAAEVAAWIAGLDAAARSGRAAPHTSILAHPDTEPTF